MVRLTTRFCTSSLIPLPISNTVSVLKITWTKKDMFHCLWQIITLSPLSKRGTSTGKGQVWNLMEGAPKIPPLCISLFNLFFYRNVDKTQHMYSLIFWGGRLNFVWQDNDLYVLNRHVCGGYAYILNLARNSSSFLPVAVFLTSFTDIYMSSVGGVQFGSPFLSGSFGTWVY